MRILLFFPTLLLWIAAHTQESITVDPATDDLNRYTLFLKGEYHERTLDNERSFLLLAQYLYNHNNVRYLVFEWGPDFRYLANRYLQTQDDSLLFKNTLFFSKAFWDTLALHNRLRPFTDKLKIEGFDFNRSVFTARAFREMMKSKPPFNDKTIRNVIENIIRWQDIAWTWEGQKKFVEQMNELRSLCKNSEPDLIAYFGDDWPYFSAIINNEVESTPMVKRDKKTIGSVKDFLAKKGEGNVLFNVGVNHAYFDGAGMASLLRDEKEYRDKLCSIYPYHRIPNAEKEKYEQEQDRNLPSTLLTELQTTAPYSLINMAQRGLYPKEYKKTQCVYVVPKVVKL
jgi:hypothetical protein